MKICTALLCLVLVGVARPTQAYVLGADFLMRLLADSRRDAPRAMMLTLNTDLPGHDQPIEERLYFKRPERMRLIQLDEPSTIHVYREGLGAIGDEHGLGPVTAAPNIVASLLFLRRGDLDECTDRLLKSLAGVGIDTQVVSLGRIDDQVVYIIGAQPWEPQRPQLWLDKSSFLPVRLRTTHALNAGGDRRAIGVSERRFIDYSNGPLPGVPRIFEEYQDGILTRHAEVSAGQVSRDLPESLFDLSHPPARRR